MVIVFADELITKIPELINKDIRILVRMISFVADQDEAFCEDVKNPNFKITLHTNHAYPIDCGINKLSWVFGKMLARELWKDNNIPEIEAKFVTNADEISLPYYLQSITIAREQLNFYK